MAEITPPAHWTSAQTRAQFLAIARLRFHIFRNGLRRKGGKGDLVANLLMVPLFLAIIFFPSVGVGVGAYFALSSNHAIFLVGILWIIFAICQFTSIQLGQPGTTFDPTQLIRFPLNFRGYAAVRIFFGLVSPANIVGTLMSFSVAIGITVAEPRLWLVAFLAMAVYAVANIFFTRMLFSWVDRWLSTRRAREIFTGLIFAFSIGIQFLNATFNPGFDHSHKSAAAAAARIQHMQALYQTVEPFLAFLPPGLTANAILAARTGRMAAVAAGILGTLVFAALFFTIFAIRLYKEFRGENLSEVANAVTAKAATKSVASSSPAVSSPAKVAFSESRFSTPPTVSAVFAKEFLYLRRNTGVFYGLIAPLAMIVIFAGKLAAHTPLYILFPAAIAYTMMGIAPMSYNSLGIEAAGVQFYFMAPVSMRDVFVAKNLFNALLAVAEIVGVFAAITFVARAPSPQMTGVVVLWAAFTLFVSMAVGNRRSVTAPKKVEPGKQVGKQAGALSALLSIGLLLVCAAIGAGFMLLAHFLHAPWILPPVAVALALLGFAFYRQSLGTLDTLLAKHRDTLSETLCKG